MEPRCRRGAARGRRRLADEPPAGGAGRGGRWRWRAGRCPGGRLVLGRPGPARIDACRLPLEQLCRAEGPDRGRPGQRPDHPALEHGAAGPVVAAVRAPQAAAGLGHHLESVARGPAPPVLDAHAGHGLPADARCSSGGGGAGDAAERPEPRRHAAAPEARRPAAHRRPCHERPDASAAPRPVCLPGGPLPCLARLLGEEVHGKDHLLALRRGAHCKVKVLRVRHRHALLLPLRGADAHHALVVGGDLVSGGHGRLGGVHGDPLGDVGGHAGPGDGEARVEDGRGQRAVGHLTHLDAVGGQGEQALLPLAAQGAHGDAAGGVDGLANPHGAHDALHAAQ
mmetsp:Transcript_18716/g.71199  ORF Transcript_18716/g.71199 Transcript_18716/m.71199 type:complete len:339 (-) Transcript_18716:448-1464(-)